MRQEDEGQTIICGHTAAGEAVFEFHWWGETTGWLVCSDDYSMGRLITTGKHEKMAIDNALMIMFALATADKGTVLFHAAVVSYEDRGYMFLGPSGTGKSTHASLWQRYIAGTALVTMITQWCVSTRMVQRRSMARLGAVRLLVIGM